MAPLYKYGYFGFHAGLMVALVLGFWFGFLLERAGFGSPRKLASIFYFRDFAVLKVMFTAIVVAMLLILYFSMFGWLDIGAIYVLPTYIWPFIVGGLLLGVGFVMGGYCPTTSLVATVSGRLDGLVFIVGMMIGVVFFAEMFPLLEGLYTAGSLGQVRLPEVLHLSSGTIAFGVCLMAVGAFWLAERAEKKFAGSPPPEDPSRGFKWTGAVVVVFLGLLLMIMGPDDTVQPVQVKTMDTPVATETVAPSQPVEVDIPEGGVIFGDDEGC